MRTGLLLLAGVLLAGCADDTIDYGDDVTDPQLPPRGSADLDDWIAAGHYLTWSCEPAPVDVRLGSPHRPRTRTCNNELVRTAPSGPFPLGAASVKEMYDDLGAIKGYGVSRKVTTDGGMGWYWYEMIGSRIHADGMGAGSCPACHVGAERDYTFVLVL